MSTVVSGLFPSPATAARAIERLEQAGVPAGDVSIVAPEDFDREAFVVDTRPARGTSAIGEIVAGLTPIGSVATGGVVASGPVVTTLAGEEAEGGSVLGGLVGWAIPESELVHYQREIELGSVLVGVQCESIAHAELVHDLLMSYGGDRVSPPTGAAR